MAEKAAKFLRLKQVIERTGLSRSSVYDKLDRRSKRFDPSFPQSASLGGRAVAWVESEIEAWIESRRQPIGDGTGENSVGSADEASQKGEASIARGKKIIRANTESSKLLGDRKEAKSHSADLLAKDARSPAVTVPTIEKEVEVPVSSLAGSTKLVDDHTAVVRGGRPLSESAPSDLKVDVSVVTNAEKRQVMEARHLLLEYEKKCAAIVRPILEENARKNAVVFYEQVMEPINLSFDLLDDRLIIDKILGDISRSTYASEQVLLSAIVHVKGPNYRTHVSDAFFEVAKCLGYVFSDKRDFANEQKRLVWRHYQLKAKGTLFFPPYV